MNMTEIYYKRSGVKVHVIDGKHVVEKRKHRAADGMKLMACVRASLDSILKNMTSEIEVVNGGQDGC